jgi:DNA polymerase-1
MNPKSISDKPTLVLIDAYSLLFRAYFSMTGMLAPDGTPTGALYGFLSMIIRAVQDLEPTNVVVAFDYHGPTFRHEMYPDYKGHREKAEEDLYIQMPLARDLIDAMGMTWLEMDGYEADDIIGTLSKKGEKDGWKVLILTGDSDLGQLVSDDVTVMQTVRGVTDTRIYDPPAVRERYGIAEPINLTDYKALVGDSSDNIPGVRGVGEKTAKKIFEEFDTIEELYKNIERVKNEKLKMKLQDGEESAKLSKELATIHREVKLDINFKDLKKNPYSFETIDQGRCVQFFKKYGFRQPMERMGLDPSAAPKEKSKKEKAGLPFETVVIDTENEFKDLINKLKKSKGFALDFETDSLNARTCNMVGVAIAMDGKTGYYIPVGHMLFKGDEFSRQIKLETVLAGLKPIFENSKIFKVCQNGKYEWLVCYCYGIELNGLTGDPMIADYLINTDQRHGLKEMAQRELGWKMTSIEELIGKKGAKQGTMVEVPIGQAAPYAAADATSTWLLYEKLTPVLKKDNLDKLYDEVEIPLVTILARMEATGIKVNDKVLRKMSKDLEQRIEDISNVIFQTIGRPINLNSPKQLSELLFDELGLPQIKKRSTDAEVLEKLKDEHELPSMILDYRMLAKLQSTYVKNLIELIDPADGRIHASYNQTVAATGRLSGAEPNMQNIPIRTDTGKLIRRAFEANEKSDVLVSADYSQIELRLLAHFSEDPVLMEAFANDQDIHARTAMEVFEVAEGKVTKDMRRIAKIFNFGIIYGMGPDGLSKAIGKSRKESREFIDRFFERYPNVRNYMDENVAFCEKNKYVKTILGRRKYYKDIDSKNRMAKAAAERAAINMPLQGSAADIIKMAMVDLIKNLDDLGLPTAMLLQVHDELVLTVPEKQQAKLVKLIGETMANVCELKVPLVVNCEAGPNWLDMKSAGDFKSG